MASDKKEMHGIDVSAWQGEIDFKTVKASGIDFVILKAGGSDCGFYTDKRFYENYRKAKDAGLYVGCYYFVGKNCVSWADGKADGIRFAEIIKGLTFEFPVFMDIETTPIIAKAGATDAVIAFCNEMEKRRYYVGIYGSDISTFKDRLYLDKLDAFDKWVARYGSKPKYVTKYGMWQSESTGHVDGISGNVDIDTSYLDYPKIMKRAKLNNN